MFFIIVVLKNFPIFTGEHLCCSLFFNKVAGSQVCNFMKRRFKHSCFPVNIAKCLRTAFLIEHLRISPYSVRMWENADHDNFECGKFLRSGGQKISNRKCKKISNRHNLGRHFVTKCMCLFYFFMFLSVFLIFFWIICGILYK